MDLKLYNEDCMKILRELPDESIDLICSDPPYKVISGGNKTAGQEGKMSGIIASKNDGKIFDDNDIAPGDFIPELYRVLKNNSDCYLMTNFMNLKDFMIEAEKAGFKMHNLLVWEKNTCTPNRWYMKNCEYTLYLYKGEAKTINNPSSKTIHQFPNPRNKVHPTEKPVELMQYYIENSSNEGDTVLDPFMGGGATGVACVRCNRNFIGMEINPEYYNVSSQRTSEEQKKQNEPNNIQSSGSFSFGLDI